MARLVSVYVKRGQLRPLNTRQSEMYQLATTALDSVKGRLQRGVGERDVPLPPLSRRYGRRKAFVMRGSGAKPAVRDFSFGFRPGVRTVGGKRQKVYDARRGRWVLDRSGKMVRITDPEQRLLPNMRIRRVSDRYAEMSNSTEFARSKARQLDAQMRSKGWGELYVYSPRDIVAVTNEAQRLIPRLLKRAVRPV